MAVNYVSLPAFRAQGAVDFSPLESALDAVIAKREKNRLLQENRAIGEQLFSGAQGSPVQPQGQAPYQAPQNRLLSSAQPQGNPSYRDAISSIESSGRYDLMGPVTRTGDRAYGKYQVMGTNIGPWTREILGREMTPQEFLADQKAQDAVFDAKFGQYVQKSGNPQDAASMWFTGRPLAQGANRKDVLGTTGTEYVRRFNSALGGQGSPQAAVTPQPEPSQPSGPNYRAAAAVAARQGNVALASQLLQQQQDLDNQAYTRQRQSRLDARQEQQDNLSIDEKRRELQKQAVAKVASIATNVIQKEQDPERKQQMWTRLLAADPDMANDLRRYGVNPADIDGSIRALVAISGGGANKPIEVSPGATLYDPGSNQAVFTAPERASSANLPSGYRTTADGRGLEFIPGGPADPALKPKGRDKYTELQSKAANFGNMMVQAEKQLSATAPVDENGQRDVTKIENPKNVMGALRDGLLPFEGLRNTVTPNDTQAYNQLAKQWIRAKLRKESGAAIGNEEMEQEFRTYFPQYGDGPEVLKQKALARAEATKGMIAESGGAYQDLFQGAAGQQADPAPAQAAPEVRLAPRPNGISNETIIENAKKAIADGKDEAAVRQQLKAWEVPF